MKKELRASIKELISKNKLSEAINKIEEYFSETTQSKRPDSLTLAKSKLIQLNQSKAFDEISTEQFYMELSKVKKDLDTIIHDLPDEYIGDEGQKNIGKQKENTPVQHVLVILGLVAIIATTIICTKFNLWLEFFFIAYIFIGFFFLASTLISQRKKSRDLQITDLNEYSVNDIWEKASKVKSSPVSRVLSFIVALIFMLKMAVLYPVLHLVAITSVKKGKKERETRKGRSTDTLIDQLQEANIRIKFLAFAIIALILGVLFSLIYSPFFRYLNIYSLILLTLGILEILSLFIVLTKTRGLYSYYYFQNPSIYNLSAYLITVFILITISNFIIVTNDIEDIGFDHFIVYLIYRFKNIHLGNLFEMILPVALFLSVIVFMIGLYVIPKLRKDGKHILQKAFQTTFLGQPQKALDLLAKRKNRPIGEEDIGYFHVNSLIYYSLGKFDKAKKYALKNGEKIGEYESLNDFLSLKIFYHAQPISNIAHIHQIFFEEWAAKVENLKGEIYFICALMMFRQSNEQAYRNKIIPAIKKSQYFARFTYLPEFLESEPSTVNSKINIRDVEKYIPISKYDDPLEKMFKLFLFCIISIDRMNTTSLNEENIVYENKIAFTTNLKKFEEAALQITNKPEFDMSTFFLLDIYGHSKSLKDISLNTKELILNTAENIRQGGNDLKFDDLYILQNQNFIIKMFEQYDTIS